ncbi:MAG: NUDIX domain-containing protein [Acidobacteria bacterium]|nr:NUDIX domain-containing protein [Acidobacteriota bacterium]
MTTVVAGILEKDGKILACRRRADQDHAGLWEFPGGKLEAGENPAEALRRELREELSIEASIGDELERYEFAYPGRKPILLIFLRVASWQGQPDYQQFAEARWETPQGLTELPFLEGDIAFNRRLASGP